MFRFEMNVHTRNESEKYLVFPDEKLNKLKPEYVIYK